MAEPSAMANWDAGGLQKSAPVGSQPRLSHGFHDR